jgi:hypothetical protein
VSSAAVIGERSQKVSGKRRRRTAFGIPTSVLTGENHVEAGIQRFLSRQFVEKKRAQVLQTVPSEISTERTGLTQTMQAVSQVGSTHAYSKNLETKTPSRVEIPVLLRAISAADWIAADFHDEGDEESARYYRGVANDLRRLAQARGVTC